MFDLLEDIFDFVLAIIEALGELIMLLILMVTFFDISDDL